MENIDTRAYSEVDKILSLMEMKYVQKIPEDLRKFFKSKKDVNYTPDINPEIQLTEQNLQRKTFVILAMLNMNYWCENEEEKQKLLNIYAENDKIREAESREKYNPDNIFNNKKNKNAVEENEQIVEYKKQNFFAKIFSKLKNFFL